MCAAAILTIAGWSPLASASAVTPAPAARPAVIKITGTSKDAALAERIAAAAPAPRPSALAAKRLESQSEARIKFGLAWAQAPLLEEATKIQKLAIRQRVSGFTATALEHGRLVLY